MSSFYLIIQQLGLIALTKKTTESILILSCYKSRHITDYVECLPRDIMALGKGYHR